MTTSNTTTNTGICEICGEHDIEVEDFFFDEMGEEFAACTGCIDMEVTAAADGHTGFRRTF